MQAVPVQKRSLIRRTRCPFWVKSGHVQCKSKISTSRSASAIVIKTIALFELGRRRERFGRVDDKHYERGQFCRPTVENFHCHSGRMSVHRVSGLDIYHSLRGLLAQPASDNIECFRAGMRMHWCLRTWRPMAIVHTQQVLGRAERRNGSYLRDLRSADRYPALRTESEEPRFGESANMIANRSPTGMSGRIVFLRAFTHFPIRRPLVHVNSDIAV